MTLDNFLVDVVRLYGAAVEERRVLARDDEVYPDHTHDIRWRGTLEKPNTPPETRASWKQPTIEQVIQRMNGDLGTWADSEYTVRE